MQQIVVDPEAPPAAWSRQGTDEYLSAGDDWVSVSPDEDGGAFVRGMKDGEEFREFRPDDTVDDAKAYAQERIREPSVTERIDDGTPTPGDPDVEQAMAEILRDRPTPRMVGGGMADEDPVVSRAVNALQDAADQGKLESAMFRVTQEEGASPIARNATQYEALKADRSSEISERVANAARGAEPPPTPPRNAQPFEDILDAGDDTVSTRVHQAIQREFEGRQNILRLEMQGFADDLERGVYKRMNRKPGQFSREEVDDIMGVLHGESDGTGLDPSFREYVDTVKERIKLTETKKIDFLAEAVTNPSLSKVMPFSPAQMLMRIGRLHPKWLVQQKLVDPEEVARTGDRIDSLLSNEARDTLVETVRESVKEIDYSPRFWKELEVEATKDTIRPGTGRPSSTYPRNNLTYKEMRAKGLTPKFPDPAAYAIHDAEQHDAWSNMIAFMGNLHKRGLIRPEREVSRSPNWRVPKVGRPFEGALLPDGTRTPSWGVMHEDAMFLERMKGQSIPLEVKLGGKRLNFAQAIYGGANVMKFTKFTLSPMQMADMTLIRMIPGYLDPFQVLRQPGADVRSRSRHRHVQDAIRIGGKA